MDNDNTVWVSARDAWAQFCKKYPALGLSGSKHSFVWLIREHGPRLTAEGALLKTVSRRYLANTDKFDAAAFALLTGVTV